MLNETDMNGVKKMARLFAWLDPQPTECSPFIIKHPFTDGGFVVVGADSQFKNIMEDEQALRLWQEEVSEKIEKMEKSSDLLPYMTKTYRLAFLKHAEPYLSKTDYSEWLAYAWTSEEAPHRNPNFTMRQLLRLFQRADPQALMSEQELKKFRELDDVLTIYRGVTSYNKNTIRGLSWTLDKEKAEWFATRFWEEGKVYEAQIKKEHVYAYFEGRRVLTLQHLSVSQTHLQISQSTLNLTIRQ